MTVLRVQFTAVGLSHAEAVRLGFADAPAEVADEVRVRDSKESKKRSEINMDRLEHKYCFRHRITSWKNYRDNQYR